MKVVIVEDEIAASENLIYLLNTLDSSIEVLQVLDSVKSAVTYFSESSEVELVFMDIHLADGISFEIFEQVQIKSPIIFTTAYDQYAIQAFKVNSVDYLLKPLNEEELSQAIAKFKITSKKAEPIASHIQGVLEMLETKNKSYKSTYLVQKRDELIPVRTEDIAYFYIETGIVKGVSFENQTFIIDKKLDDIEEEIDPAKFYRVNRQFVMNRNAISNIKYYFNGKLVINSNPKFEDRIVVSKAKATEFKKWVNT